jgi:hypothetical protein
VATIKAALTDAYQQVHEDSAFTVTNVELEREVTFPETGNAVNLNNNVHMVGNKIAIVDDDNVLLEDYLTGIYWVDLAWTCLGSGCNNEDNVLPGLVVDKKVNTYSPDYHKVFEGYFCHNLRVSGDVAFEEASGCKISFSNTGV